LEDEVVPEILRCPLEQLVLQAKLFNMGEPKAILALALDPPDSTNLENTILLLKEVSLLFAVADQRYMHACTHVHTYNCRLFCYLSVHFFLASFPYFIRNNRLMVS
jgi:hypothetical protein